MEQITDEKQLKKNTIVSTFSLFFQSGYSAILGLIANVIVTVILTREAFGIYTLVLSSIAFLNYFSDIGLAASLVQKKEVTEDDIKTTFTIQQMLIITLITIAFFLTEPIMRFYEFPPEGRYIYWGLLAGFFISSLKTIPSIMLERHIQFKKIVLVQIIENTFFYLIVSLATLAGLGLNSFTVAVLARSVIGLILMYSISFWKPQIGISKQSLKTLLSFGLPFQASSFLALFKDDLLYLYLGKVLGTEGLGSISWAKKWAEAPIRIIMDNLSKVLFPTLSRFQHDKEKLQRIIDKILYYQTLILAPALLGMALVMPHLVKIIPNYSKWEHAVPLFYLFVLAAFFSTYSSPFINLFNALGKVRLSFGFMVYWTAATWILVPVLTHYYGYFGFPITQVFLSLAFIYVLQKAKTIAQFDFWQSVTPAILSALIMGSVVYLVFVLGGSSLITMAVAMILGGLSYIGCLYLLFRINPVQELKTFIKTN